MLVSPSLTRRVYPDVKNVALKEAVSILGDVHLKRESRKAVKWISPAKLMVARHGARNPKKIERGVNFAVRKGHISNPLFPRDSGP